MSSFIIAIHKLIIQGIYIQYLDNPVIPAIFFFPFYHAILVSL